MTVELQERILKLLRQLELLGRVYTASSPPIVKVVARLGSEATELLAELEK